MSVKKVSRRRKSKSKASLLVVSLLFLLMAGVFGTAAYLTSQTDSVVNTFTPGTVTPGVEETFNGQTKENVSIKNTGNFPAYIRAAIIVSWVDENDNVLAVQPVEGGNYTMSISSSTGWIKGSDGFYYWTQPVEAGEKTAVLINSCSPVSGAVADGYLSVEILAQSIQAKPKDAVENAWNIVAVNDNGSLSVEQ